MSDEKRDKRLEEWLTRLDDSLYRGQTNDIRSLLADYREAAQNYQEVGKNWHEAEERAERAEARVKELEAVPGSWAARALGAEAENEALRAEVAQARKTSQFHKDNHFAAEARVKELEEETTLLTGEITSQHDRLKRAEAENEALRAERDRLEAIRRWLAEDDFPMVRRDVLRALASGEESR